MDPREFFATHTEEEIARFIYNMGITYKFKVGRNELRLRSIKIKPRTIIFELDEQ